MKKWIIGGVVVVALITFIVLAISLVSGLTKKPKEITINILNAIESNEPSQIKNLYAPSKLNEINNIDNSINQLNNYFTGDIIKHRVLKTNMKSHTNTSGSVTYISATFLVTTSTEDYHFYYVFYSKHFGGSNYEGLWSLSIVKQKEDTSFNKEYIGDGADIVGLFIGKRA